MFGSPLFAAPSAIRRIIVSVEDYPIVFLHYFLKYCLQCVKVFGDGTFFEFCGDFIKRLRDDGVKYNVGA